MNSKFYHKTIMLDSIFDNFSNDEQCVVSIRGILQLAEEENLKVASLGAETGTLHRLRQVSGAA